MGLAESRGKLAGSMRDLMALWSNTKMYWNDANSELLEQTILQTLEMDIRTTASAMDQMGSLLTKIRHECE
jgi:hypothetical protein